MSSPDSLTVLRSRGPRLTKTWLRDGTIKNYDRAKNFTYDVEAVDDIAALSDLLTALEAEPRSCVIRGLPHERAAAAVKADGQVTRDLEHFYETPHHWVCLDVDDWTPPNDIDPVAEPERAVRAFIGACLPLEFAGTSCHWQLSSSAGKAGAGRKLMAHLWFWLDEPRSSAELEHWARALKLPVDVTVFRTVQVHYTAAPVIEEGASCPVTCRSGFIEGVLGDEVELRVPEGAAPAPERGRKGMADPREKTGVHGAFCRLYPPARVIDDGLVPGFEWEGDGGNRITWATSRSGAPGGVCITDDELHFFNAHAEDPFEGKAVNAWDFVRRHRFGELDEELDADALAFMRTGGGAPSERAMREWARRLDDVAAELAAAAPGERAQRAEAKAEAATALVDERERALQRALAQIAATGKAAEIETVLAPKLAVCDWVDTERAQLAKALQDRLKVLGAPVPIATARQWLAPVADATGGGFPDLDPDTTRPLPTVDNVRALCRMQGITLRYNTMTKEAEVLLPGAGFSTDNVSNASVTELYSRCRAQLMRTNMSELSAYVTRLADANQFNEPLAWIESKPWDGADRLQAWYDTVRTPPEKEDLKRRLMRRWAIQSVAILHNTGRMMARGMLVFGGRQNQGKGKWLKSLAPGNMAGDGLQLDPHNKDSVKLFVRHWLVEVGELDVILKRADIGAMKNFISLSTDKFRAPYAPRESVFPRRTSAFGTVNDLEFLVDTTGNTRFWVIPVDGIVAEHGIDMQQLWAQVLTIWKGGEQHWLTDEEVELLNTSNEDHEQADPIFESLDGRLPWGDPEAELIWATASRAAELAGMTWVRSRPALASVGAALTRLNGGKRRRSHGRTLFEIPVRPGQDLRP